MRLTADRCCWLIAVSPSTPRERNPLPQQASLPEKEKKERKRKEKMPSFTLPLGASLCWGKFYHSSSLAWPFIFWSHFLFPFLGHKPDLQSTWVTHREAQIPSPFRDYGSVTQRGWEGGGSSLEGQTLVHERYPHMSVWRNAVFWAKKISLNLFGLHFSPVWMDTQVFNAVIEMNNVTNVDYKNIRTGESTGVG